MAHTTHHHGQKITLHKRTVKVKTFRDEVEYPRSIKKDGKYILPWESTEVQPDTLKNVKYSFRIDRTKIPGEKELNEEPLMEMMPADTEKLNESPEIGIRTTWLGHATALFQMDNVNILVNPNFSNNPGNFVFHKRYRQPVYSVAELPRIDCVFITNTHFDYLDIDSVRSLNERFGEMLLWYVPMGLGDWMQRNGCSSVVEMDWWKEDEVDFIDHEKLNEEAEEEKKTTTFKIACTPSQSAHTRTIDNTTAVLWCSWVITGPRYNLFISGATGYNEKIFRSIGRRYGPFHMAALPIGRYCPDWKFAFGNVTPEQAVKIQQDVLAMCALAVSWGTINVSNEYYLEPPQRLAEELKNKGLTEMQFFLLKHGESRLIDIEKVKVHKEQWHHHHHYADVAVNGHAEVAVNGHADVAVNGHADVAVNEHVDVAVNEHADVVDTVHEDVVACEQVDVVESEPPGFELENESDEAHDGTHRGSISVGEFLQNRTINESEIPHRRTEKHVETHTHDGVTEIITTTTITNSDGDVQVTKHTQKIVDGEEQSGETIVIHGTADTEDGGEKKEEHKGFLQRIVDKVTH